MCVCKRAWVFRGMPLDSHDPQEPGVRTQAALRGVPAMGESEWVTSQLSLLSVQPALSQVKGVMDLHLHPKHPLSGVALLGKDMCSPHPSTPSGLRILGDSGTPAGLSGWTQGSRLQPLCPLVLGPHVHLRCHNRRFRSWILCRRPRSLSPQMGGRWRTGRG